MTSPPPSVPVESMVASCVERLVSRTSALSVRALQCLCGATSPVALSIALGWLGTWLVVVCGGGAAGSARCSSAALVTTAPHMVCYCA